MKIYFVGGTSDLKHILEHPKINKYFKKFKYKATVLTSYYTLYDARSVINYLLGRSKK